MPVWFYGFTFFLAILSLILIISFYILHYVYDVNDK